MTDWKELSRIYDNFDKHLKKTLPYRQRALPELIPYDRIHIALAEMEYRNIISKCFKQVFVFYGALGGIMTKPKLRAISLRRPPSIVDPNFCRPFKAMDLIID